MGRDGFRWFLASFFQMVHLAAYPIDLTFAPTVYSSYLSSLERFTLFVDQDAKLPKTLCFIEINQKAKVSLNDESNQFSLERTAEGVVALLMNKKLLDAEADTYDWYRLLVTATEESINGQGKNISLRIDVHVFSDKDDDKDHDKDNDKDEDDDQMPTEIPYEHTTTWFVLVCLGWAVAAGVAAGAGVFILLWWRKHHTEADHSSTFISFDELFAEGDAGPVDILPETEAPRHADIRSVGCENGNNSDGDVTDNSENRNSSGIEIFIGENPNANRDSNWNQVLVQPAASSEERLQPPPRAPPAINPMLNRLVGTRNESYFKIWLTHVS